MTDERESHIAQHHPDLLPEYLDCLAVTLADPDAIRQSSRFSNGFLFSRWFTAVQGGKYVVVSDQTPVARHWVITAYIARKLAEGTTLWHRP